MIVEIKTDRSKPETRLFVSEVIKALKGDYKFSEREENIYEVVRTEKTIKPQQRSVTEWEI